MRFSILVSLLAGFGVACSERAETPAADPPAKEAKVAPSELDTSAIRERAKAVFGVLPADDENPENPFSEEKIKLGRMLYFDTRLSKNHDVSCNSCHQLDRYGVDNEPTSPGHKGQRGGRNSPTVYNASLHIAQFWDGRAKDVEEQAGGPVLNPIEMAMPSEEAVLAVLNSIDGYRKLFNASFPVENGESAVSYANMANAIGAFERKLMTPSAFDAFLEGDDSALTDKEVAGLETFMDTGCITCHAGPTIGGQMFQKLGLVKPYGTEDAGRFEVTGNEADRGVFKVPSMRNVAQTAPYFHDGSIETLDNAIRMMAEHQLGKTLAPDEVTSIRVFLGSLTGKIDPLFTGAPKLPESGPDTPSPDPT
jgi:cytochrome c peroxidase